MTSSSDAPRWQPLALPSVTPGFHSAGGGTATGFALALVPPAGPVPSDDTDAGWLPQLQTDVQAHASAERRALVDDAFARGREEGVAAERARADERCRTALEVVAKAADHLEAISDEYARDRERDLQAAAITVARHIVQHELTIDPLRVGELVRRALELLPLDHVLEIRLHPEDLRTLAASLVHLLPEGRDVKLQWLGDPSLERGGFIIETPQRVVDGRTDVALRALYDRFEHE